jgi:asparagine synthase (glutamine-hydrolysing)
VCGIVGFRGRWGEGLLQAMTESVGHRGPDGHGSFYARSEGVALGHVRLSIIDLSDQASQPFHSNDSRYVISYNGEVYNYEELRSLLAVNYGSEFRTKSDTEVLLNGLVNEGVGFLHRIHGIFAFAMWDRHDRTMLIGRDHLGVKPLYYASLPEGLVFASEMKAIVRCPDLPRELDSGAISSHLAFMWAAGDQTILKAVRKLRPGHVLISRPHGHHVERYYRTPLPDPASQRPVRPMQLRDQIDEIVAEQMVADVPVGALLSGGLDSSAIVASMCRSRPPDQITTFCARSQRNDSRADNFGDDEAHATLVASQLGVTLHHVETDVELAEELPGMVWALDEPTPDFSALQTWKLAQQAKLRGIKVLLSGTGADDLFTGYGRHRAAYVYEKLASVPGLRQASSVILRQFSPKSLLTRRLRRVGLLLGLCEHDFLIEAMSFSDVGHLRHRALMDESHAIPDYVTSLLSESGQHDLVTRLLHLEQNTFLPDHNLNYADKMAMRVGVEVRVPFVTPRLVDLAMSIPIQQKMTGRWSKDVLRRSQIGRLPRRVLYRSKQGFGLPLRAWLAGPGRELLYDTTSEAAIAGRGVFEAKEVAQLRSDFLEKRADAAFTLFAIMCVEIWCRTLATVPRA